MLPHALSVLTSDCHNWVALLCLLLLLLLAIMTSWRAQHAVMQLLKLQLHAEVRAISCPRQRAVKTVEEGISQNIANYDREDDHEQGGPDKGTRHGLPFSTLLKAMVGVLVHVLHAYGLAVTVEMWKV